MGSSLSDTDDGALQTNFEAQRPAQWYARRYRRDNLTGGHIIQLGPGNDQAAKSALAAWPGGMQVGGGINPDNAAQWLQGGASAVIVTSWVFYDGRLDEDRLRDMQRRIGRQHLVLDLSCRRQGPDYFIVTNRWQTFTRERISFRLLDYLAQFCCEYLIHAVDVEGKCQGIETTLVEMLGQWNGLPITYAGGIHSMADIDVIESLGRDRIDFTVGSALDIFGGQGLRYADLVRRYGTHAIHPAPL